MKLGGLFSGVGGFELAWTQLGHEVAWMCEWDAKARKVLEARFPGVPIYPDVRDLDPAEVEAVDVLTGGSPCQGFSVAGNRTGLEHSESQLFRDYVRIMDGLAERGLRYALWENVPGVLSITNEDGERTFNHVVAALAGGTEPVRLDGDKRWNTGMAAGRGRAVAWRVLDSRYFGVAQRRRRVFACVAFGDSCEDRAGRTLLAVAEGVRGDSPAGIQARKATAGSADGSAQSTRIPELAGAIGAQQRGGQDLDGTTYLPDFPAGYRMTAFGQYEDDDSASTLKQRDHKDATDLVVTHALTSSASKGATEDGTGRGTPIVPDRAGVPSVARTLKARADGSWTADGHGNEVVVDAPQAFNWQSGGDARGLDLTDETSALTCQQTPAVMLHVRGGVDRDRHGKLAGKGPLLSYELSATLDATQPWTLFEPKGDTRTTHAIVEPRPVPMLNMQGSKGNSVAQPDGPSYTLNAMHGHDVHAIVEPVSYGVRRLTPVECERLQSFPDGWTEPAGSDSARYKAMGNAVTVNVVRWILNRMVQAG